jgi:XisI protein
MDRVDEYRDIIERILEAHPRIPFGHGQIESKFIIARDRNNFVLMMLCSS